MQFFQLQNVLDTHQEEEKLNCLQKGSARSRDGCRDGEAGVEQRGSRAKAL